MQLPETHRWTEKQILQLEGKELDRMVGLGLGHYKKLWSDWFWPHLDTHHDAAAPYSTHPLYVEYLLVATRTIEVPEARTSLGGKGTGISPSFEDEWVAGPIGWEGVEPFAYGETPMLAISRYLAILWKRDVLPYPS